MKKLAQGTLILSSLLLASHASANDSMPSVEKNWSVGVGAYTFSVAADEGSYSDIEFNGFNVDAGYAFNNHFQVRGTYFVLENDDVSSVDSKGLDIMVYGGVGFSKKGFRGYGGGGFFTDKWSIPGRKESFSGIQLGGGVGYNWGDIGLDFVVKLRQADKYEDFVFESGTYIAASGNLTIAYLF